MWILQSFKYVLDGINSESDEATEAFIDQSYFYMTQVSMIYLKLDRKHRLVSILQFLTYYSIIAFDFFILIKSSLFLIDINFIIFTHNTHIGLLTLLVGTVLIYFQFNRKAFVRLHRKMSADFYEYNEPELESVSVLREEMLRQRRRLAFIPASALVATGSVLLMASIVDKYGTFDFDKIKNSTSETLPYNFANYPFDPNKGFAYYITLITQLALGVVLSAPIGTTGYIYIVITQNIVLQQKILLDSLENLEKRSADLCSSIFPWHCKASNNGMYDSKEFAFCYKICLRKNFQHHQIILSAFHDVKELFSVPVFLSYMVGTIVIALSLLSSTGPGKELPGTTIASVFLCIAEVGFMYLFSVFSQYITDLSLDLHFKIYSIKWYYCDRSTTMCISIFQTMALQPMTLVAGGIVPANIDTFGKVMNSAYSYYNLVNAFNVT